MDAVAEKKRDLDERKRRLKHYEKEENAEKIRLYRLSVRLAEQDLRALQAQDKEDQ